MLLTSWVRGLPFTDTGMTEGETALTRNRIPFRYKVEIPMKHPSGGIKEAGFERGPLQE